MRAGARSTTRSTAPTRFPRPTAPRRARATIPGAAPRSSPGRKNFLDEAAPLDGASWADVTALSIDGASARTSSSGGKPVRLRDAAQFAGYRGAPAAPDAVLLKNNGLHIEIVIDRSSRDRQDRPGRHRRRRAGIGADHHPGLRGFGRRGRCRGQGRGLPQLARPDEGRPRRRDQQGRQDLYPQAQPRPRATPRRTAAR